MWWLTGELWGWNRGSPVSIGYPGRIRKSLVTLPCRPPVTNPTPGGSQGQIGILIREGIATLPAVNKPSCNGTETSPRRAHGSCKRFRRGRLISLVHAGSRAGGARRTRAILSGFCACSCRPTGIPPRIQVRGHASPKHALIPAVQCADAGAPRLRRFELAAIEHLRLAGHRFRPLA